MKNFCLLWTLAALFVVHHSVSAQQIITMKDNSRLSAMVIDADDNSIVLTEGSVSLSLVHSVQFLDSAEVLKKLSLINFILSKKIEVYLNNERLLYKAPPATIQDSIAIEKKPLPLPEEKEEYEEEPDRFCLGLGLGIDYGGVGGRMTFLPQPNIGFFISGGYNFKGFGYNVGLVARINPDKKVVPNFIGMYGYNGVIIVEGATEFDKVYYGASLGVGLEVKSSRNEKNFFQFELLVPIRPQFDEDIKALINNPSIEIQEPLPFLISLGYHFGSGSGF